MPRTKKKWDKYITMYATLNKEEYDEFKKYLSLDKMDGVSFVTEAIKQYNRECKEHYKALQLMEVSE